MSNKYTSEQLIYKSAIEHGMQFYDIALPEITPENVEDIFHAYIYDDDPDLQEELQCLVSDGLGEMRGGEVETELPCESCRHYESKSVASCIDGRWIGWTYWYGGGKHGQPESVEFWKDAYELNCVEKEILTISRTFTKKTEDMSA